MLDIPGVRFAVGACGTKFGKTWGTSTALIKNSWNNKGSVNWWISPTYSQTSMVFDMVKRILPENTYHPYVADRRIVLLEPNGSEHSFIDFKSADNSDSLRGYGVNFFVMDEAARCSQESWVSLYTTVTQTMGKGYIISTPKGRGWFYDIYQWGVKFDDDGVPLWEPDKPPSEGGDPHPDFLSIRMPTWTNPWVKMEAIEGFKRNMTEDDFRQEIAAEFFSESAGVFRGIKDCIDGSLEDPQIGASYVMGVDLARLKDYSVITVMDRRSRHVVDFQRFNQISWDVQYQRIIKTARKYNAVICMDSTGIGDPIVGTIQNAGVKVLPYTIGSSAKKQQLIDKLRVNLEKKRITFPRISTLIKELEAYEFEITPGGAKKYFAPSNQHDDCVISLALANWIADTPEFKYSFYQMRGI